MIKKIRIKNIATYGSAAEELYDLEKINFIYGSNGTGKTTIARVIADNTSTCPDCEVIWQGDTPIKTLVYNRDFIENNFNQPSELKGIFTLGEKDKDTLDKIEAAKSELDEIKAKIVRLRAALDGENGESGKTAELKELEAAFKETCWGLKLKHDEKFQGAFGGVRGDKHKFMERLLEESKNNLSTASPLDDLETKAATVFGETPQIASILAVPNVTELLAHEANAILRKNVIGKTDVDIAALIQKLNNSDWVKEGRKFYDPETLVCPFCQQDTKPSLEENLNEYFDESFESDIASIEKLFEHYQTDSESLQQSVLKLLNDPSPFLNTEKLQSESDLLDSKIRINIQRLEDKRRELSKSIELDSLRNVLDEVKALVEAANSAIRQHNTMTSNLEFEKAELTGQVWRYLLDHEIKNDLETFNRKKTGFENGIKNLKRQIEDKTREQNEKEHEIQILEKDTTSIQPTINGINALLRSFGFTGFVLAKSDRDRFYKIQRSDGTDAKESLSEGEKSFITFLYFYYLLKGSETESGMTSDRVCSF